MRLQEVFGTNLQRIRRDKGFSQEQLAGRAQLSRAYLSGAEAGRRNATLQTIEILAAVLEVKPVELLIDAREMRGVDQVGGS